MPLFFLTYLSLYGNTSLPLFSQNVSYRPTPHSLSHVWQHGHTAAALGENLRLRQGILFLRLHRLSVGRIEAQIANTKFVVTVRLTWTYFAHEFNQRTTLKSQVALTRSRKQLFELSLEPKIFELS